MVKKLRGGLSNRPVLLLARCVYDSALTQVMIVLNTGSIKKIKKLIFVAGAEMFSSLDSKKKYIFCISSPLLMQGNI